MFWLGAFWFVLGLFIGSNLMVLLLALCSVSADAERRAWRPE